MKNNLLLLLTVLLTLSGCLSNTSTPASFYVLNADLTLPPVNTDNDKAPAVEISSISLPTYLDRKQIVTRQSENQLQFSEQNRWGGNLRKNLSRVLVKNLSHLLQSSRIAVIPHSLPLNPEYRLEVSILRFERNAASRIILSAQWRLIRAGHMNLLSSGTQDLASDILPEADDYEAIVEAMSKIFAKFSETLARNIVADAK